VVEAQNIKKKFQLEQLVISEDGKTFVHVIKFKKRYQVRKNDAGEVTKFYYRGKYEAFEESFDYYDFEIFIGRLDLATTLHTVHLNEERNPLRKT
jgi:hypothetical protein